MSEEVQLHDPELELSAIITKSKGKPQLMLTKHISNPEKIRFISALILNENYIPCRIVVKDKLRFYANLKEKKLF